MTIGLQMIITLIGYRGCGKSTVAALLAEHLGWEWVDADVEIERVAGCTIREIFAEQGEPAFRLLEQKTIADLLTRESLVLAAGGGAVLDSKTRQGMRQAGPVVWLQAPTQELAQRITADETTGERRPQLTEQSVVDEIETVLAARAPLYRETATLVIETGDRSPQAVAQAIHQSLRPDQG